MATRSAIAITHGRIVKGVYCHWDGYLDNNGAILETSYDRVKANQLIALGDISSLGAEIGEKHAFDNPHPHNTPEYHAWVQEHDNITTFYGRDRGEKGTGFKTFKDADEFLAYFDGCGCEYYYLMHDGIWYVNQYGHGWERLEDALRQQEHDQQECAA